MSAELPPLSLSELASRLGSAAAGLPASAVAGIHAHYLELRRWNRRLSLVGPGTSRDAVERHYLESLAALGTIGPQPASLLDVGSGAGFPGLVLAICRPTLRVTLLESQARKAAFLRRAAHLAGTTASVLEGFLDRELPERTPEKLDFVTLRAVRLGEAAWTGLAAGLSPSGRVLQWSGPESSPPPRGKLEQVAEIPLSGSERRVIRVFGRV